MDSDQIINRIGGTQATADLCVVSKSAVSQWRINGIPKSRLMFLRLARPDVFKEQADRRIPKASQMADKCISAVDSEAIRRGE